MPGKQKCRILKEIRQRIADENDIPYVTRECHFQGECTGTCPRCESELRYLEQQLALRAALGKKVAVAALCAGMTLAASGCSAVEQITETILNQAGLSGTSTVVTDPTESPQVYVTTGEVAYPEPSAEPEPFPEGIELMGDIAYIPDIESDG